MAMAKRQLVSLTDAAAARVQALMTKSDEPALGLRLSVRSRGCSGMSYEANYATEHKAGDEVVEDKGATVFIDPGAILFLAGTEIDYREDALTAGFVFRNPNETGRCGCGESFTVQDMPAHA